MILIITSDQRNNHDRKRERRMKRSKTINISSGGEGGGLARHEMAIFQCKDLKGKFILFFSDKNSTAELITSVFIEFLN